MLRLISLLLLVALCSGAKPNEKPPTVQIENGLIQGTFKLDDDNKPYMHFSGIPYARPPVGKLRFARPQPARKWEGTWVANNSYACIQVDHADVPQEGLTRGSEDCLYLNVFVPGGKIDPTRNMDVIVHIHGGGFMFGSSYVYAYPKHFMNKDIVFVTMNYRLGIFGFLSLEDKHLAGNLGMRDQVMSLQWIQDNIRAFGGNPDSVTLTGLSAGGASVHYHMLSPLSKGLFHKAISVSGNALDPWTLYEAPRQKAKEVSRYVGCNFEESKELLDCLRKRPADQLVEVTKRFRSWAYMPFSPFGLVIDNVVKDPFLPAHPYKLLDEGKINDVPWLATVTTAEGLYPVAQLAAREGYFEELKQNWEKYCAGLLHYDLTVPKSQLSDVAKKIKQEYLGDKEISKETYNEIIKLSSDRLFLVGMEDSVRMHAKAKSVKSPSYFLEYDYATEETWKLPELLFGYKEHYGVSHGDDILLIFEKPNKGSQNDQDMSKLLVKMWVDMAKTGRPNNQAAIKKWQPVSRKAEDPINYLYIGSPSKLETKTLTDLGNKAFWKSLPFAENEKLFRVKKEEL